MSRYSPDEHSPTAAYPSLMAPLVVLLAVLSGCGQEPGGACPLGPGRCDTPPGEEPSPSQAWSFTGDTSTFRIGHTATLLPNGKVLVVGGVNSRPQQEQKATAELYDPGTGTWSSTGSLTAGRTEHTATLLPNGKVLVVGGVSVIDDSQETPLPLLVSAELYDPETGTWSLTDTPTQARVWHTATLLQSGKVLVVGGNEDAESLALVTAEVYDPGTGTWSPAGSLLTARAYPSATLLRSGKVLVVGGTGIPTAELYTP